MSRPRPRPPTASQTWQRGAGYGRTATAVNPNAGLRNGAGYGAVANQAYLAEGPRGVSQDAVRRGHAGLPRGQRARCAWP